MQILGRTRAIPAALLAISVTFGVTCGGAPGVDGAEATAGGAVDVEEVVGGLERPWGMAFLPDGRLLITERPGRLRVLGAGGALSEPLAGTPEVFAVDQGGLLDVALDPGFESNRRIYLSFAEPGSGGASTALGRGVLGESGVEDFAVIFRQEPKVEGGKHFGGRIVFRPDGTLFLTLGERFLFEPAQDLSSHLGTIVRINPDGSVPADNPFVEQDGARGEIWSYGHRNIEAAALHPETGELWVAEMGPEGGDELNLAEAGRNYGWPEVSWGQHYVGTDIPDPPTEPQYAGPATYWNPVISPSGMIFYSGEEFADWQGYALIGGLSSRSLIRVAIDGREAEEDGRIELGARIRDVRQGPQGGVYLLTDHEDGAVWRLRRE